MPVDQYHIVTPEKKIEQIFACLECEQKHSLSTMEAKILTFQLKQFHNIATEKGHTEIAETIERIMK